MGLLGSQDLATNASVLVKLFAQSSNPVALKGFPVETSVESIAWYLLSINPFLDYAFTLPGKQSVLMLDWAKDEDVLFSEDSRTARKKATTRSCPATRPAHRARATT